MRHIRFISAVILMIILLVSAASAEEITISGRVNAIMCADKALEENYGITMLLQDYFNRTAEEKDDGVYIVRYEGADNFAYVLGRYEVTVDGDHVTGIT